MQMKRWQIFSLTLSAVWVVGGSLLASQDETWIAAWKLYCTLTADFTCVGATVYLVAHWDAIAGHCILPSRSELAGCLGPGCIEAAETAIRAQQLNSEAENPPTTSGMRVFETWQASS
jgi:hypothetical protein